MAAPESYPEDLRYHPEHDWARIEGDEATLGITWYAQDSLGELVHYEPPDVGATLTKDSAYGEVESVKAVSDLIAPLSGEVLEVNAKVVDEPETVNEDPYGDGWLVRIRLSDPAELDALLDVEAYRALLSTSRVSFLSLTDADREEMLAAVGVSSIEELFRDIPEGVRLRRAARPRTGAFGARARCPPRAARGAERSLRRRALLPRRRCLRPLRSGGRRRGACSAASC